MQPARQILGFGVLLLATCHWARAGVTTDVARVTHSLSIGTSTNTASAYRSEALGDQTVSGAWSSHSEGFGTRALGFASHAQGGWSWATGQYSHAEGLSTRAYGESSHAGGNYTVAMPAHSNAFIHATGNAASYKQTQFKDTAHFDRLYAFEASNDSSNSVPARWENDNRYAQTHTDAVFHAAVSLATPNNNTSNSVLARWENDDRYAQTQTNTVFHAAVYLVAPQGDISMGSFTNGAPQ